MKTDHVLAAVASLICATAAFARERIPVTDWTLADHGSVYAEAVGRGWLAEDNDGDYLTGRALSRVDYAADNATRWNVASVSGDASVALNPHFAERGLTGEPGRTFGFKKPTAEPQDVVRINCAGYNCGAFAKDPGFLDGAAGYQSNPVVMSDDPRLAPPDVYRTVRWSSSEYDCLMTGKSRPYLLRLHFSESSREKVAGVCKFDVKVNGKVVLPDFDVAAAAGGINRAVAVDVEVESDAHGHVRVEFAKGEKKGGERHRDPRVCGIEVLDFRLPSSP